MIASAADGCNSVFGGVVFSHACALFTQAPIMRKSFQLPSGSFLSTISTVPRTCFASPPGESPIKCVGTPLDGPATIQKREVLGFRNEAQHLETFDRRRVAFVARPDSLLADVRRRDDADTNRVIGP